MGSGFSWSTIMFYLFLLETRSKVPTEAMCRTISNFINLYHFITVVVDDFHSNLSRLRLRERSADSAVKTVPGFLVYIRSQRPLELIVGFISPCKVGVAHEVTLTVVIGVDKPAGDVIS